MIEALSETHNILRWLVLGVGLVGVSQALWGASEGGGTARLGALMPRVFVGLLDLQFLLGVILLVSSRTGWVHAVLMLGAVALAHVLHFRAKRSLPEWVRGSRIALFAFPMIVIFVGVNLID